MSFMMEVPNDSGVLVSDDAGEAAALATAVDPSLLFGRCIFNFFFFGIFHTICSNKQTSTKASKRDLSSLMLRRWKILYFDLFREIVFLNSSYLFFLIFSNHTLDTTMMREMMIFFFPKIKTHKLSSKYQIKNCMLLSFSRLLIILLSVFRTPIDRDIQLSLSCDQLVFNRNL